MLTSRPHLREGFHLENLFVVLKSSASKKKKNPVGVWGGNLFFVRLARK